MIEIKHRRTGEILKKVDANSLMRADLREANLYEADLYGADLYGANLCGANLCRANLRGTDLRGANLYGTDLKYCKGVLSFTGEKHLLIYFKYQDTYYFKIGCMTKTKEQWLEDFKTIGTKHDYGNNTQLYGDVIKLFSQYDLMERE